MEKALIKDIIEWDVGTWSEALHFWAEHSKVGEGGLDCLELGGRNGGLSLWMALNGNKVICSDLDSPAGNSKVLHSKYNVDDLIDYQAINAANIPFTRHFDIIAFKSILGTVSGTGNNVSQKEVINGMYRSLKTGGQLLFAENLEASSVHRFFRRRFTNWSAYWNYLKYSDIADVFSAFKHLEFTSNGYLANFGRTETQRNVLTKIDKIAMPMVPNGSKYVVFGVATK